MPDQLVQYAHTAYDLLLVVLGFGLIIFIHELGHFLAAKWAGIRVLAFAIGFGPALASYRRGLGLRRGSSEGEYADLLKREKTGINPVAPAGVSPTEYRLNWLPFGGYVKMLGQEDLDPGAVSTEKDSYQNTPVWKRMIVISAGVVMNVLLAALLFVAVFMHGLETEPPKIGGVVPGRPAATAVALNAGAAGVTEPGLKPGDEVIEANGQKPLEFTDLMLASAMTSRDEPVSLLVKRPGVSATLRFEIKPRESEVSKLREIGIEPALTAQLPRLVGTESQQRAWAALFGVPGLKPGMRLVRVGENRTIRGESDLNDALQRSGGNPVEVEFVDDAGAHVVGSLKPRATLQAGWVRGTSGAWHALGHLLGLVPVMSVGVDNGSSGDRQGLHDGDIFARLGSAEFPSIDQGIAEIHARRGQTIEVGVLRKEGSALSYVPLTPSPTVKKTGEGVIGFAPSDTADTDTLVALPPALAESTSGTPQLLPAASLIKRPGTRILSVAGKPVHNFAEIRSALVECARTAASSGSVQIPVTLELPLPAQDGATPTSTVEWRLTREDLRAVQDLGWSNPLEIAFEPETYELKAAGPVDAIRMGVAKTSRVMVMTYVTFARLFEGTVKVEHLKGPVGIAHLGTRIAERGFTWLLFFMGVISVNLAVINFLPLPIVDGGQFLFLVLEQIRGKPVSIELQNLATIVGVVLIGAVFLIVTFHDITGLFSG
jgi:regulator of sigma E protease